MDRNRISHQFASHVVDDLKRRHPGAAITVRVLARNPLPHIDEAIVTGRGLSPEKRSPKAMKALELSDTRIGELEAADTIVGAAPMYNFGIGSSLKAWIDHIARPARTFSYSAEGPEDQLKGKKAVGVVAHGGVYSDGPMQKLDFQESYLRTILGFVGITNIPGVRVEGGGMGQDAINKATASAKAQSEEVVREIA